MNSFSQAERASRSTQKINIAKNDIHLWVTKPEEVLGDDELLASYTALLNETELTKQQRYKFAKDRHDALVTRAFIRDLLSYYADISPQEWQFEKGIKDKPEVVNCPIPLRFNISHTKSLIICAVTLEDDIGCDVENTGRNNNVLSIAERYYSQKENEELFDLPVQQQHDRFYDYWTLKESYIKAWGLGLSIPLVDFSFSINDEVTAYKDYFAIKSHISLCFAEHREDKANVWRNWLIYPSVKIDEKQEHRIALALRAESDNQNTDYQLRFFDSLPLLGYREL
ncbi:4'-phosphopantetheinyl transferase superfamily protein [Colwellia sp. E2M01]|uniref:4'-phosphopantetheinyl transferase family protein n=1 Tax=Colwellia sp. E2M01 TaxID=2841561 RepID=UPI001C08B95E|nr:4'-phosphopantetheinyl transferase superfamily protein [Colwellia sp. E2M01]MBU2871243.1 4'-phosphopantetheinyl transferase superfamily protein [Colwellia sp. E2M01]